MRSAMYWYLTLDRLNVPTQVGNQNHIMHNKFSLLIDTLSSLARAILLTGFGKNEQQLDPRRFTRSGARLQAEFDQMFDGRFGYTKERVNNNNTYTVGDTHGQKSTFHPKKMRWDESQKG